jgi:hypothetical protein
MTADGRPIAPGKRTRTMAADETGSRRRPPRRDGRPIALGKRTRTQALAPYAEARLPAATLARMERRRARR